MVALSLTALLSATTHAQLRSLPAEAKAGHVRQFKNMTAVVDRAVLRLAPGAQIRDTANRIVMPGAVPDGSQILYVLDRDGLIRRAWIPTSAELAQRPVPPPFVPVH